MANFNIFTPAQDPLLTPEYMDTQIQQLVELRDQMRKAQTKTATPKTTTRTVWDDITEELNSMTDAQKEILFCDGEYKQSDNEVAMVAARYQMSLLMPYVVEDAEGKKSLEKQLHIIRAKKDAIIKQEQSEREEFLRWKEKKNKKTE